MAESEEAEVDYYAVLNDSKEVKIVFQRERKMNLKLRTDSSACHINLGIKTREKEGKV